MTREVCEIDLDKALKEFDHNDCSDICWELHTLGKIENGTR